MSAKSPESLIARHEAFLNYEPVDRPLLGAWMGGYFPGEQFPNGISQWTKGQVLCPKDVCIDRFKKDYESLYEMHRKADDDFFYIGSAYWGVPWLEAILGCPVVAGNKTCWAESCLNHIEESDDLSFSPEGNQWLEALMLFTEKLVSFADTRFPVCPTLLRGPGDAAAAMRGSSNLIIDYMDAPETTKKFLSYCADVRLEVIARLNGVIPAWHETHAAGGYPSRVWSKRTVAYNQEDSAALLSPQLFKDILLPLERKMCQTADINFIHLHSGCIYPIEILLKDDSYAVLEINIDHDGSGASLGRMMPLLKLIQEAKRPLLLWGEIDDNGWNQIQTELSPVGLSIQPIIKTPEEMVRFNS